MRLGKKWVAFVTAPDQVTGEMWCAMLRESGINCQVQDANPAFIGPSLFPVRLMAPENQCELALHLLEQNIELAPVNEARAMRDRKSRMEKSEEVPAEANPGQL